MIIIRIIEILFQAYMVMLFLRILGSWFPEYRHHKIMLFLTYYTDPYLNIFRKLIPPLGILDISPIFAFLALGFIQQLVKAIVLTIIA